MKTMNKRRYSEFAGSIDIDAFELAIGFEPTDRQGDNDIGHCPDVWGLHKNGDTTGKFAIHRGKQVYNCWVCGGGSLLSLTMDVLDMGIEEATAYLRQFTQADMRTDAEFLDHFLELIEDTERRVAIMPYFNERVLERFDDPIEWWYTRGLDDDTIALYNLRYSNHTMKPAPVKQQADGMVKIGDDYYGPVAIIPHYWKGRLVGWQNRWMEWDENHTKTPKWLAKYTNTLDFPKSDTLFNFDLAVRSSHPVIVVESVVTALLLARYEIPAVSFFGGGIKEPQLRLLRKFQQGVILAPDNDSVGEKLVHTATQYLERYVDVQRLPPVKGKVGADLGDFSSERFHKGKGTYQALKDHINLAYSSEVI